MIKRMWSRRQGVGSDDLLVTHEALNCGSLSKARDLSVV